MTNPLDLNFQEKLRMYAAHFSESGIIFAASNMHGENWGNIGSQVDIGNLRAYLINTYSPENEAIEIVAFSMGGLSAMDYTLTHIEHVNKLTLLAATNRSSLLTDQQVETIQNVEISIYHGQLDENIYPSHSDELYKRLEGTKSLSFQVIGNIDHWNIESWYVEEIATEEES